MSLISVTENERYLPEELDAAVAHHFEVLGVAGDLTPGMRILLKPNLLAARRPEKCVTTHPLLIDAVVRWLKAHNMTRITIADSPGGPYLSAALKTIYAVCGLRTEDSAPHLNYDTSWQSVPCPEGFSVRSFNLITPVCEADYIINLPKMKTHMMTTLSGAVKNLFGAVPGLQKPELHYRCPDMDAFCGVIAELAQLVAPQVSLMDAIESLEGNGPSNGTPRRTGLLLASRDVFALDLYAARLMGLPPDSPPLRQIREKGLADDAALRPETEVAPFSPPMKLPDSLNDSLFDRMPGIVRVPLTAAAKALLRPVPRVRAARCTGCGLCAESCPPQCIVIADGIARISYAKCISCFCCQEMCPQDAMEIRRKLKL